MYICIYIYICIYVRYILVYSYLYMCAINVYIYEEKTPRDIAPGGGAPRAWRGQARAPPGVVHPPPHPGRKQVVDIEREI